MIKTLIKVVQNHIKSPAAYARSLGVTIGKNCLIDTRNWPSEGYLVTVGNNVQITRYVSIYCHGGGAGYKAKASRL